MDKKQINILELLNPVIESLPYPAIILSFDLNVVLANQLFAELTNRAKMYDAEKLFSSDTASELKKKFLLLRETNITQKLSSVQVHLEEKEIQTELIINRLQIEEEEYYLIIFSHSDLISKEFNEVKLEMTDQVRKYLDEELNEFFSEISSLLPFTLLVRNRIKKILDSRPEIIWFKDEYGKLFLSNKNYDDAIGISSDELQNKNTDLLIFPYQSNLLRSACEYLKLTKKAIVIEGLKFTSEKANGKTLLLLPIIDTQGKFYYSAAIISKRENFIEKTELIFGQIFSEVPLPVLILSQDGLIKHANEEFIKLAKEKINNLPGQHIQSIFPYLLTENLSSFLESELKEEQIQIDESFNPVDVGFTRYFLKVRKHFNPNGKPENLILLFYPFEKADDLEHLIKHRGRMFDILIQKNPESIFIYDKKKFKVS